MHFYSVKHDLHFGAILNTLQRYFKNNSKNHHINIFDISFKLKKQFNMVVPHFVKFEVN